ncbi:tRNA (N6-threonylcarbamoyladenosine(37)-N6)-methyltransferase TrmO [Candidatus Bipolaricaulota bacterium]|nr:tRNA (N6-threonylcarbamoyladenosine(37)-N6)-methyltransferase TrmO [Candidatus Bipolaricaulota bacterium]
MVQGNDGVAGFDKEESGIVLTPIGTIHSPFTSPEGMPIQPTGAAAAIGTVEVFEPYRAGLKDLDSFSHVILLYHFHRGSSFNLSVIPFMDTEPRGVFATRAPRRPNPLGLSVVQLERIEEGILYIRNLDILDGTPLLDIKPYVPEFDAPAEVRTGWIAQSRGSVATRIADERFS